MEAERYARAKRVFLEASRLPTAERPGFVRAQCGEDDALADRVARLLAADSPDSLFLEVSPFAAASVGLAPGTRLGGFTIIRTLGEGGMGIVYEAQEDEPHRRVALKLIRPAFFSERLRSRFRHEIRVLGQLQHPGIAQIYEAGTLELSGDRVPYFAMELVRGEALLAYATARALGVRERLILMAQVCDAVHHAHQKGVIHRDLKPANILVEERPGTDPSGGSRTALPLQVKVLDFGVARATDSAIIATTAHTDAGQLIGTLAYMSPEQAAGEPGALDTRSDVYSIGVIAYELLTGRLACDLEGKAFPEAARAIAEQEPARLGLLDRSLAGDAETIVAKALQKDPRQRYQSAAELAADIRRHLRDEPIVARPASAFYQLRKFARRHKALVVAAALVVLAMAAATGISTWQARVAERARAFAEGEQKRADAAAAGAKREAHRATLAGAAAAIGSGDPITAARLLNRTDDARRDWAWRYWHARLDESVAVVRPGGRIAGEWLSPDGGQVAVVTSDGSIRRGSPWDEVREVARLEEEPALLAVFVDQARRIITDGRDRRTITLFDAADGRVICRHEPLGAPLGLLEASPDGRAVFAAIRRRGRPPGDAVWLLRAMDPGGPWAGTQALLETGTAGAAIAVDGLVAFGADRVLAWEPGAPAPRTLGNAPRAAHCFALSEDGSRIATGGVGKTVRLWDRATGNPLGTLIGHTGAISALAFDRSGDVLASAAADLTIRLWDTASGQPLATLIGHTDRINRLQFSADASVLLSASGDGSLRLWRRDPSEGSCVLRDHTSYVYAVAFTRDGSRMLSGGWDGMVRAWDAAHGGGLGSAPCGLGFVTALAVSPDGRTFASGQKSEGGARSSSILLWDAAALRPLVELERMDGEIGDLIYSADGARLYVGCEGVGLDELDLTTRPPGRRALVTGSAPGLALSPRGDRLACSQLNGSILIVTLPSGEIARRLEGHKQRVRGVAFHPRLPLLASASDDGTARLWDLNAGTATELRGHADRVYALAFSPDGRTLATGSEDTTIGIWDVASGEQLTRLRGHEAYVYALAFSPDGTRLLSGSGDHTVRVWDTRPVHERWRARMGAAE